MWLIDRRMISYFDFPLLIVGLLIPLLGVGVLYSAGFDPDTQGYTLGIFSESIKSAPAAKQLIFIGMGLVAILFALTFDSQRLTKWSYLFYGVCVLAVAAVLVVGKVSKGSSRWLPLGFFNFQPSELMKIALILALARLLSRRPIPPGGYGFKQLILPGVLILIPMILIVEQPDLGTALTNGGIGFLMLLFVGVRWKTLLTGALLVISAVIPIWHYYLLPYQQARVLTLFDPGSDPRGSGYHVIQSKIAVGSGALTGKGFLRGTQTQLQFLPEHTTDFIFSVLAEEWGFIGCFTVLCLYLLLIWLIMRVASRSKDLFSALVCVGVAAMIFIQSAVNTGMVIGILPVVGITLPLFSYGGSSIVSVMIGLGLVLSISMRRFTFSN